MPNLNQYLLSEPRFFEPLCEQLKLLLTGMKLTLDESKLKKLTYASWQQRNFNWADQVFHGHWRQLGQNKNDHGWCYSLLDQAARFHLVNDSRRLAVKDDKFNDWQYWLSNQSGFPVMALQLSKQLDKKTIKDNFDLSCAIKEHIGRRGIISPYNTNVEDYINREGLHEAHLHLNGTTLFEQLWNETLMHPNALVEEMITAYKKERVQLLYASYPFLDNPNKLLHILHLARRLRETLLLWLVKGESSAGPKNYNHSCDHLSELLSFTSIADPVGFVEENKRFFGIEQHWSHIEELNWQVKLLHRLKQEPAKSRNIADACYLLYLQCMNCFHHLLVQRSDQYGFDQFQKFADNDGRSQIEKSYKARFFQLHGPKINNRPDLGTLEGRFAPKGEQSKNIALITDVFTGFLQYAGGLKPLELATDINILALDVAKYSRPNLRLVAHFIKLPWSVKDGGYHFQNRRTDLDEKAFLLCETLDAHPNLRAIITGIDAAANELESPPEVFAPVYRYCRSRGFRNFTFHTGEDFEHLLGGIRSVYDAIKLLELQDGDRIGHATAIGIDPQLWLNAMPDKIYLKQAEWLNNLLFLRKIALENLNSKIQIGRIETKIRELCLNIYSDTYQIEDLQEAWRFRGLRPSIIADVLVNAMGPLEHVGILASEFQLTKKVDKRILKLLQIQTSDQQVLQQNEIEIEIDLSYIGFDILLEAQQYTQAYVAKQKVVIETLPTSNVRISHYKCIEQHHVFRWLQIPEKTIAGDSKMLLALGSDDPGIFATDMRNEFYHLFTVLTKKFKYSARDALGLVASINENGRIYRFDGPQQLELIDEKKGLAESH
jgi:adenosine deaminase